MIADKITAVVKRALDMLFVVNPTGTSLGVFIGIALHGVLQIFEPFFSQIKELNLSAITPWHLCAGGIVFLNIKPYLKRNKISPQIIEALLFIENERKSKKLPEWQYKKMYINLIAKVIENATFDSHTEKNLAAILGSISKKG